ncbi:CBS domain-containing protein [Haliea sp. E1-2-M8]|uniref:CBS domain-containing protein n=1 Tax=Haliea sp. E1-2-M8 TaxID=3064706 RepID=UPI002725DED9|nr:CBS domain-containing protein [Haliea sp. E1-2-M8]MDO8863688.1 CBS domain-containing protein [Haliea sp. E1-2-M8]
MKKLHLYPTLDIDELEYPKERVSLSLTSSALEFFTDFHDITPLIIPDSMTAVEALKLMRQTHVRMKFVVDNLGQFVGVVSADDLVESKIVMKVAEGYAREALQVRDFMTHKKTMKALDFEEIVSAQISDVIAVLKQSGQQHCLVVDQRNHRVRGIFSASDISRKLHLPIDIQEKSSFYKVFSATA